MEKTFIVSREKFLELKQTQKRIVRSRKIENKDYKDYVKYRRLFYHSKGMQVPNDSIDSGFIYSRKTTTLEAQEARYFHIIYSLIRGRSYAQIEPRVHEEHELERVRMDKYCKKYGVDFETIRSLIWQTS